MLLMKEFHGCIGRIWAFQCVWDELVTKYGVHLLKSFTLSPVRKSVVSNMYAIIIVIKYVKRGGLTQGIKIYSKWQRIG